MFLEILSNHLVEGWLLSTSPLLPVVKEVGPKGHDKFDSLFFSFSALMGKQNSA